MEQISHSRSRGKPLRLRQVNSDQTSNSVVIWAWGRGGTSPPGHEVVGRGEQVCLVTKKWWCGEESMLPRQGTTEGDRTKHVR